MHDPVRALPLVATDGDDIAPVPERHPPFAPFDGTEDPLEPLDESLARGADLAAGGAELRIGGVEEHPLVIEALLEAKEKGIDVNAAAMDEFQKQQSGTSAKKAAAIDEGSEPESA